MCFALICQFEIILCLFCSDIQYIVLLFTCSDSFVGLLDDQFSWQAVEQFLGKLGGGSKKSNHNLDPAYCIIQ